MFTLQFIIRNLIRQPVTSALTLVGVSLGIGTIVALGALTSGVERSANLTLKAGDADFVVSQRTSGGLMFSLLTEEDWHRIERMDGVADAIGVAVFISRVGSDPFFRTIGIEPGQLREAGFPVVEGRPLSDDSTAMTYLGDRAASQFGARTGDTVSMAGKEFVVSGVFRTGNRWLDAGAFSSMEEVQSLAAKPGLLTMVYVRTTEGTDPIGLAHEVRLRFPHLTTISDLSDYEEVDQGLRVLQTTNLAVSVLAVVVAAAGVMNTMARSVFERTREIGILRAIGWRTRRIVGMVLAEALLLCAAGAVAGSLGGVAVTEILEAASQSVQSVIGPTYEIELFVRGAVLASVVAVLGVLYPALRASRLEPLEALRSE